MARNLLVDSSMEANAVIEGEKWSFRDADAICVYFSAAEDM